MRFGLLRVPMHDDDAVKHRCAFARGDAAIGLVAPTARRLMLDEGVMIDVVVAVDEVGAIELALGALPLEQRANVETQQAAAQRDHGRAIAAVGGLSHVDAADLEATVVVNAQVADFGIASEVELHDGIRERAGIGARIALGQRDLGTLAHREEHSRVAHAPFGNRVLDLERSSDHGASRNVNPETIFEERGVQRGKMLRRPRQIEAAFEKLGLILERVAKAPNDHALGDRGAHRRLVIASTLEGCIDDRPDRREAPRLRLLRRQPLRSQRFGRTISQGAKPPRARLERRGERGQQLLLGRVGHGLTASRTSP